MFTGSGALSIIGAPGQGITLSRDVAEQWWVFVQSTYYGVRHLEHGTRILYKVFYQIDC